LDSELPDRATSASNMCHPVICTEQNSVGRWGTVL